MKDIVLFGAGKIGRRVADKYKYDGRKVVSFIDNNPNLQGTVINGVEVISLEKFSSGGDNVELILTCNSDNQNEIEQQLKENGINNYSIYYQECSKKPNGRIISYSDSTQKEDLILYNVLKDEEEIFYIDVGCNDPFYGSVTKLFYDMKNAHGINIDPQRNLIDMTIKERPRDINLCLGLGDSVGEMTLYLQGSGSTFTKKNRRINSCEEVMVKVDTLSNVCKRYIQDNQKISLLKIDVEGFEKQVLLGADFEKYRPKVLCIESTLPKTMTQCHDEWEYILIQNRYHFTFSYGVNRYYVANEERMLEEKFLPVEKLVEIYDVWYVGL